MNRTALPQRRRNETREVRFGLRTYLVCVGFYDDGSPAEVFVDGEREGSDMRAIIGDACVLISIALQCGIATADLGRSLARVPRWSPQGEVDAPASIIGAIIEAIEPERVTA
jgi:ribonucleoside-diphosphate reductase alpha chain